MSSGTCSIQRDHFEVDQYVRVQLSNGRSEIGIVVSVDEPGGTAVIATRHGYDITVRLSSVRRAFLLVLDLNGVLVARGKGSFVDRPGVEEFIQFVMNNFVVSVWTSGLERTSNPIIEKVLDSYQDRLLFKLYRDACTVWPTPDKPYRTIKNLQRIFDAYPKSFHAVNTIIVDDSPDKCSHPDIALCPVPFNDPERQKDDTGLRLAMDVLREVLRVESHAPLIRASEERLLALAAKEKAAEPDGPSAQKAEEVAPPTPSTAASPQTAESEAEKRRETFLWSTRLCCDYILGGCARGEECRFSHDADDGKRPCSRKNLCRRGHARRWVEDPHAPTSEARQPGVGGQKNMDVSNIMSFFSTNPDQQKLQQTKEHMTRRETPPKQQQQKGEQAQRQQLQIRQLLQQQQQRQQYAKTQQQSQPQQRERERERQQHHRRSEVEENRGSEPRAKQFERLPQEYTQPTGGGNKPKESAQQRKDHLQQTGVIHITGNSSDGNALVRQLQASLTGATLEGGGADQRKYRR